MHLHIDSSQIRMPEFLSGVLRETEGNTVEIRNDTRIQNKRVKKPSSIHLQSVCRCEGKNAGLWMFAMNVSFMKKTKNAL